MFGGLKFYTIHNKPDSRQDLEKPIFLREGFNWLAFIFTFIWAVYHRLWSFALVIFAANVAIVYLVQSGFIDDISGSFIQLALQIIVGFHANDFLRARFKKQGYVFQDIVSGDSLLRAELRYFDRLVTKA